MTRAKAQRTPRRRIKKIFFASWRDEEKIGYKDDSRKGAKGAKFGEIGKFFSLRSWRPFGFAQDRLGAINFVEVILSNI